MWHNSHKQALGNPGFNLQFESKEDLPINVTFDEPTSKGVVSVKILLFVDLYVLLAIRSLEDAVSGHYRVVMQSG